MKDEESIPGSLTKPAKVTPSVLEAFDNLKSPKEDIRLDGGTKIVSMIQGNENDKEVIYTLKRLVRSLGANNPELRMGYFATLTTILKQQNVSLTQILDLVKEELHNINSSKSEIGDVALGQILVCGSVFRSGLLLKSPVEVQTQTVTMLLSASSKKSYLGTIAYQILIDFVNTLDEEQFASIIWTNMKKDFKKKISELNLDTLYFLLVVSKKFPKIVKVRKLLGNEAVLSEDTVHDVTEKVMTGIDYNSVNHPIYKEIGTSIANSPFIAEFWTGIDSQLSKHNRNRELVALTILSTVLQNINENYEVIPDLLSNNFFKLFMDWFKGLQTASKIRNKRDDEEDHKIMIKKERDFLNTLAKTLKSPNVKGKVRVATLEKLLFNPGEINFSEVTGTTVVKSIIADLDSHSIKKIAKLYKGILLNTSKKVVKEGVERVWYNNERLKAAESISYLVGHEAVKDDTAFKLDYMRLLMCFGFFKIGFDNVVISAELSGTIKSCFYRCFNSRFSNVDHMVEVLSSLCEFISKNMEKDSIRDNLEKQFPKENMECWQMLNGVCHSIEKNENKSKVDKVFLILLYQLGLFLFSEPKHVEMATSSIKELKSCYDHYKSDDKKKKRKVKEGDIADDEPEWIEVLVEVLLSILSTDSSVLRSVVQCVFRLLTEYLTPTSVGQIVSVLDPDQEENPLTAGDDDSSDDEQSDEDESNDDEKVNGVENESNNDNDDDDDDEEGEDEEDDDEEDMKAPDQLKIALQKVLGSAAPDTDTESIDADMIDEEEGKKLDAALADAFKQFHGGKNIKSKKERKDKKVLSDFRIRVLDLVDVYLEKDPAMDITLALIAPLVRCLEVCIQDSQLNELEKRLRKSIKTLTKIRKFSSSTEVTTGDMLCDYLKSIIEKGTRSHFLYQALGDVITHCATFIIHCSQKIPQDKKCAKESLVQLFDIFKDSLQNYFHNRNCLLPIIFFHNVLQTEWIGAYDLVSIAIENAFDNNVRQFRRNEALELTAGFYRSLKQTRPTTDDHFNKLKNIESEFEALLKKTLQGGEFSAKNNFFVTLRKLINTMAMYHESCKVKSYIDCKALLEFVNCNKNVKVNNDVKEIKPNGDVKLHKKKKKKRKQQELVNGDSIPRKKVKQNN